MKKSEFCHFWAELQLGTGTKQGWYRYHLSKGKMVPVPSKWYRYHPCGTGTTLQNRFGTGTKHSGTGTTGSCNPGFWYFCIVKLNSHTESIRTLINDLQGLR